MNERITTIKSAFHEILAITMLFKIISKPHLTETSSLFDWAYRHISGLWSTCL